MKLRIVCLNFVAKRFSSGRVGILGCPFAKGQKEIGLKEKGLEVAPDILRKHFMPHLKQLGMDVKDYGNVSYNPLQEPPTEATTCVNYVHVVPILQQVRKSVETIVRDGRVCLTLGGDHSLAAATICGHAAAAGDDELAVVYVDAHADINIAQTSYTGNMHGMPLSIASKELQAHWATFPGLEHMSKRISLKQLGYIGLRSVDPGEAAFIADHNVAAYSMNCIVRLGIAEALQQLLKRIDPESNRRIHLSLDIDSLDPLEAPSTTVPVRGGLLLREVIYIAEELYKTKRLSAVDIVEVNPLLGSKDDQMKTLDAARDAILACFGQKTAGNPA